MAVLTKAKSFVVMAMLLLCSCNGCNKVADKKTNVDTEQLPQNQNEKNAFAITPQKIFSQASHFAYRSEMSVTTKKGSTTEEASEAIEVVGAKPRIHLKKKTDNLHFIEIIAENDAYFVRNSGKEFRRASDDTPLCRDLLYDGLNLLHSLLQEFDLYDRVTVTQNGNKKIYTIGPGAVSLTSPYVHDLAARVPQFLEPQSSDASGTIIVDEKTGVPLSGNLFISIQGKEERALAIKASFSQEMRSHGDAIVVPAIKEDEQRNFPVDIGRRFKELLDAKVSK